MRVKALSLLLYVLVLSAEAQTKVFFQLNLNPLEQKQLLSPDESFRVYVRGSFNNWQGTSHELTRNTLGLFYSGTFDLEGAPGDTVSFKYVIEKGEGRFFWEEKPDPSNPDHGNRRLVLKDSLLMLPEARFHPGPYFTYPVIFTKEELRADFKQFRSILEETHPALYDYTEKAVLDSLFDRNFASIEGDMDFRSFLILMTGVISRVGCGHSSLWIPGDYWTVAPSGLFPLKLQPVEEKFYVTGTFSDSFLIPVGSELYSINGLAMAQIVKRLESLSSSDGMIQSFRRAKVGQNFALKYAMAYGFSNTFAVRFLPPGQEVPFEAVVQAVSKEQLDRGTDEHNELSFRELDGESALLTINTFGYYGQVDMFKSFVDSVFQVIDQKGIENLIMDLRGNGGGDPFCASYLWGYLQAEPLPYFEDHYGRYDTLANPIPLPPLHFRGRLFTLIDGLGFSTTGHFCGLLKYHRVGKFVGTETGATFTCTGNATYPPLDNTGIMVGTARVMRYTAAVKGMDPGRGVQPDYYVVPAQDDLISGRDAVLDYALSLAAEN
jgi:C-terminal processing protease CtpA/Prc